MKKKRKEHKKTVVRQIIQRTADFVKRIREGREGVEGVTASLMELEVNTLLYQYK